VADRKSSGTRRSEAQAEIEKEYGDESGTNYGTLVNLKGDVSKRLQRAVTGVGEYGTELSPGSMQAREAAAGSRYKPGFQEALDSSKAKRAGREAAAEERREARGMKKGGAVKSASARADGVAQRGKTRGRML
jgi:hypothetical protein